MQLLSVNEYARLRGITPQAVYKKVTSGKLKTKTVKVERIRIIVEDTDTTIV